MHIENPKLDEAQNPNVTHEPVRRELTQLLLQLGLLLLLVLLLARALAWALGNYLPYSYEQKWLARVGSAMMKDTQNDARLQTLAEQLAPQLHLPDGARIQVHTQASKDVNAFATFGAHVILMQGLLDAAPTEQAVSMVLAHEMGHVAHRDPLKALTQNALLQLLSATVFGEQVVVDSGLMLSILSYSRAQETSADEAALDAIHAHYGSIAGAIEMYDVLAAQHAEQPTKSWVPDWLATHPDTQARQAHLRAYAQKKGYAVQGETRANPWRTAQATTQ